MKKHIRLSALAIGILALPYVYAQTTPPGPVGKPENATALCKDGTYSTVTDKSDACRGHHGIKDWYIPAPPASPSPEPPSGTATQPSVPPPAPATPSPTTQARTQIQAAAQSAAESGTPPPTQSIKKGPEDNTAETAVPPGGGPGFVWLNKTSQIYHCFGTRYYGKTKSGEYMTEADAKARGAHRARGEVCHP